MCEVVMKLEKSLKRKGHVLVIDRGFSLITFADELSKQQQYYILSCKYVIHNVMYIFFN